MEDLSARAFFLKDIRIEIMQNRIKKHRQRHCVVEKNKGDKSMDAMDGGGQKWRRGRGRRGGAKEWKGRSKGVEGEEQRSEEKEHCVNFEQTRRKRIKSR